jgi:hypothetical protein
MLFLPYTHNMPAIIPSENQKTVIDTAIAGWSPCVEEWQLQEGVFLTFVIRKCEKCRSNHCEIKCDSSKRPFLSLYLLKAKGKAKCSQTRYRTISRKKK